MLSVVLSIILGLAIHSVVCSGNYGHSDYVVSTDYTSRYHGPGATPVVLPDGTLADTPEVAAARGAHLAALHKAQALWYGNSGSSYGTHSDKNSGRYAGSVGKEVHASYVGMPSVHSGYVVSTDYTSRYHGPGATPVVLSDGTLANTPEVAAARSAHLTALHKAQSLWYGNSGRSYGSYSDNNSGGYAGYVGKGVQASYASVPSVHSGYVVSTDYTSRYHGPGATPVVLPDGTLANTPEVAAARSAHLAALHKAQALWYGNSGSSYENSGRYAGSVGKGVQASYTDVPSGHSGYVVSTDYTSRYHGPGATPVVKTDGTLANTPEVVASRDAHLLALQKAKALWYGNHATSYGTSSGTYSGSHTTRYAGDGSKGVHGGAWSSYSGPLASPTVLHSGYLADSSDVSAAKLAHLNVVALAHKEAAKWPVDNSHNVQSKQW